jgi:hypothetical protein
MATNSVYTINKGINKSIEFKGLKAQYIWYLGGGLLCLLVGFAIMYVLKVNTYLSLAIIIVMGVILFSQVYKLNNQFGEHGMMKHSAKRMLPTVLKSNSRKCFQKK